MESRFFPPLSLSLSLIPFSIFSSFRSVPMRDAFHRTTVLGRKPLSHLVTDGVVNNGDDAQEIPRSPAIYRRRDIARIADANDR